MLASPMTTLRCVDVAGDGCLVELSTWWQQPACLAQVYWTIAVTPRIGVNIRILSLLIAIVPLAVYPVAVTLGSVIVGIGATFVSFASTDWCNLEALIELLGKAPGELWYVYYVINSQCPPLSAGQSWGCS